MKKILLALGAGCLACALLSPASAGEDCGSFKWDVRQEHQLFLGKPAPLVATRQVQSAPPVDLNKLYELELLPQEQVEFAVPLSKNMLTDGAFAGQVRLRVPQAGNYRIAVNAPFWLDVSDAGQTLKSVDFNGSPDCDAPRKIVVFALPAQRDLVLQLGGAIERSVRLSITAAR